MSIACIFGMGASSVIARQLGEGREEESARCFHFSTYAMALSGILVLVLGLLFIQPMASLLGADGENRSYTCDYLRWIFLGAPAISLALGNAVNVVLDWIFIVLLAMGTKGAAMATSIGFICAAVYYFSCLLVQEKRGDRL